jgi:hypothetical protein
MLKLKFSRPGASGSVLCPGARAAREDYLAGFDVGNRRFCDVGGELFN